MKKVILSFMAFSFFMTACDKSDNVAETKIVPSKTTLKTGEQLTVNVQNSSVGSISKWNVQPSGGAVIDSVYTSKTNTMRFTQTGTYTIIADMRSIHPDCRPSLGWDTCFNKSNASRKLTTTVTVSN